VSAAPGRLRLRRVAFARLARIREEHGLRLADDEPEPHMKRPRVLTDEEEQILAVAKELTRLAGLPSWGAPQLGALLFLHAALRAEKAVAAWWTPERWRRMYGRLPSDPEGAQVLTPPVKRPTPQGIVRDLLPLAEDSFVLRAPSVLAEMERLAVLKALGEGDALDGFATVLGSAPKAHRPRPPLHERDWLRLERYRYESDLQDERNLKTGNPPRGGSRWPDLDPEDAAALRSLERRWRRDGVELIVSAPDDVLNARDHVKALKRKLRRWSAARTQGP
jgi:hypothetical protein